VIRELWKVLSAPPPPLSLSLSLSLFVALCTALFRLAVTLIDAGVSINPRASIILATSKLREFLPLPFRIASIFIQANIPESPSMSYISMGSFCFEIESRARRRFPRVF
jgi:hypothetical protein